MSSPARFNMTRLRLDLAEMTVQRDALLAALRNLTAIAEQDKRADASDIDGARAAIAKATKE